MEISGNHPVNSANAASPPVSAAEDRQARLADGAAITGKVVGVTPDTINPLSEVDDGAEVAEIMEQARPKTEAGKTVFQKLFQRHMIEAEQARAESEIESRTEALIDGLATLRSHLQTPRQRDEAPTGMDHLA